MFGRRQKGRGYTRAMADTKKRQLRTLRGLRAEHFQHPHDVTATQALQSIPGMETIVSKVMEYGFERVYYLENIASNVRVTEKMFGRVYRSLQWACKILDVEEPELYLSFEAEANAFTYGRTRPFIVLTTSLVDMLDDQELFFVIAHELGHIKAGHPLYTLIARNIAAVSTMLGQVTLGLGRLLGMGLELALYDWMRKAELTADRAGLLCVQDLEPCTRTFMKLAGGASRLYAEMDRDEFMRQALAYDEADRSDLNRVYKLLITAFRSHPFAVMRAKELHAWHASGYEQVFAELVPRLHA
jgi:Zn-dependent protease with chaperone function